jgi:hypothetical protein
MAEVGTSNRSTPASATPPTPPSSESTQSGSVSDRRLTDRHSDLSVLQLNYDGSNILFFRVPLSIKIKYMMLDKKRKKMVKQSLIGIIEALAQGGGQAVAQTVEQQTVVLNLNLNVQQQAVNLGDDILEERVRMLEKRLRQAQELLNYYKDIVRRVRLAAQQNDMKTIRQILSKVDST